MELILASRSPRRAELLRQIGLEFRIVESSIKEEGARTPYDQWVRQLALKKAEAAQKKSRKHRPCRADKLSSLPTRLW